MSASGASELVLLERRGRIALLTLNHPPVNVLSTRVLEALSSRISEVERDPEVRVLVLASGADRAFAAGADIREMAALDPSAARLHAGRGQSVTRQIERLPLPVIAAVHGICFGGGCEIALACDFIVASEDASFGQPEINLGVMPGWGGTRRLPRRIGAMGARRWILTGRAVPAKEAHSQGLVERVVPRAELLTAALELANELAGKPPVALAAAKYAILHAIDSQIDDGLAYELDLWSRLFGTSGQKEGMRAFLEKRSPPEDSRKDWDRASMGFPWAATAPETSGGNGKKAGGSGRD